MKKLKKNSINFYNKLNAVDLSIIPIKEIQGGHKPNLSSWKPFHSNKASKEQIKLWHDEKENVSFALLTGYNDVECIDIDNKVIKDSKQKQDFNNEYFELLENHIDNFYEKFCIVQTQSGGFHILYKTLKQTKSTKIAKLKDHKEAIIESKGKVSFVYIYDHYRGLKYHEINFVSDEDKELLWQISQTYNYIETKQPDLKRKQTIVKDGITPWEDFINKNNILDIATNDFDIVRKGKYSTLIKRQGADSYFSGHIFDNSGKMYLFSTGTIYPAEQPLNSFDIYAFKYFNGDYSRAAKQAYSDGYGDRYVKEIDTELPVRKNKIDFPIDIYPSEIQSYFIECNNSLNASVDFMGSAFLWLSSIVIGNTLKVKVKNGWIDNCSVWISVIGNAGVGKTPDLNLVVNPLKELNKIEIKRYIERYNKYEEFTKLEKKDKEVSETIAEPIPTQFLVDDITNEGLVDHAQYLPKGVGVYKDELAGWFLDMNKYRAGSDKQFWLSAWSGQTFSQNRKTAGNVYLEKPFIPILGGIQPKIFKEFMTAENKDSGFLDRMLFCDPNKKAEYIPRVDIDRDIIDDYKDLIVGFNRFVDTNLLKVDKEGIESNVISFNLEAQEEFYRVSDKLVDMQNSENELGYFKGAFAKQITYLPRFALLIESVNCIFNNEIPTEITKDSVLKAERLVDYFISMAKDNKNTADNNNKLDSFILSLNGNNKKKVKQVFEMFPDANKQDVADIMGITRQSIYNHLKDAKV